MADSAVTKPSATNEEQDDAWAALRAKKLKQASVALAPLATPEPSSPDLSSPTFDQALPTNLQVATTKPRRKRGGVPRPDRDGQVMISGYFSAETRRRLKILAARHDKTLQQVMADAFEAWLRRHDKGG